MDHRTSADARQGLISPSHAAADIPAGKTSISGFSQFKLIMGKNALLKWRSGADFACEMLAPLILIFGISCLSLTVSLNSHDASGFFTSSLRDSSVDAFLFDRVSNLNKQWPDKSVRYRVGDILFAYDDPSLAGMAKALCRNVTQDFSSEINEWNSHHRFTMNSSFTEVHDPLPYVVHNVSGASCENGLVKSSADELDAAAVRLAESDGGYNPILGGVLLQSYSDTKEISYAMYFNRSYVQHTSDDTNPFTFYPSSFWMQYTSSGFLAVQQKVEEFMLHNITGKSRALKPMFQAFPHNHWKYDPFKYNFLAGNFQEFFGYCIIFALSTLTKSIVEEKKRKIKEGMLMMGLKSWVFWGTWICTYLLIFLFVSITTTAASFVFVFEHSDFLLVFSFIFLFLLSVLTLALFLSTLFTDPGAASISAIFFYLACVFTPQALLGLSTTARTAFCTLCPMAFFWGFSVFGAYEGSNQGVTFSNIHEAQEAQTNSLKLKNVYGMLALDTVLYLLLAWYCDKVIPGEYGAKEKWYFIFNPRYWAGSSAVTADSTDSDDDVPIDPDTGRRLTARARGDVEEMPASSVPSLRMEKLRKVFVSNGITKVAVEEMNLDVYEDQVTALLGHNGAGKSTCFNMLTGLMKPTSGDARLYQLSVVDQLDKVRLLLGVCPQHDVLWDQLTVREHLELFAALKGVPAEQIEDAALRAIADVGLTEKTDQFSCTLSGGMKRKLSIGIAVIGDSKVIFLDEPTSGMDPYSRRRSWDIIKEYKQGHVVLFTTHFMDEADLLGDRIAIMSEGRLRCCGSSLFLKKRFGLGYTLTVSMTVGVAYQHQPVIDLVMKHTPGSTILSDQGATLSFQVPFERLPNFPMMFEELDGSKTELQIDSWGISMTTLEEVFLKLAHMKHADDPEERRRDSEAVRKSRNTRESAGSDESRKLTSDLGERVEGVGSFSAHMVALFKKRLKCALRDQMNWVLQVIVPMIFLLVALVAVTYGISTSANSVRLEVAEYNSPLQVPYISESNHTFPVSNGVDFVHAKPLTEAKFKCDTFNQTFGTMAYPFSQSSLETLDNSVVGVVEAQLVNATNWTAPSWLDSNCGGNELQMQNYLIGTIDTLKNSRYGAFVFSASAFNSSADEIEYLVLHNGSAYHAMPTFLNMASQIILQHSHPSASIATSIVPLAMTDQEKANNDAIKGLVLCFFLIIAFSIIPSTFVYSLVTEVSTKSKHQQMISGVNSTAYWLSSFVWDAINYLLPATCAILMLAAFDVKAYLGDSLSATIVIFLLYGASSIGLTYMLSFNFKDQNNALLACIALYAVSGFILFFVSFIMGIFPSTQNVDKNLRYIYRLSPQYSFAMGLYEVFYNHNLKKYSSAFDTGCAGKEMIYMALTSIVFMILTLQLQHGSTSQTGFLSCFFHRSPEDPADPEYEIDDDVENEAALLDSQEAPDPAKTPIIARHLRKVYFGRGNVKAKVAVRDLSFHVPEGEVFGLLGINGAGKTTSLSMLSGEFPPTEGEGLLNGMDMMVHREEINRSMGYCPQFDALFNKMTGREHLQFYARVKGIPKDQEATVVDHMIHTMDLSDHADRESGGYSGGNKRKLSVAIALMGSPRIVFLDEPSTGMDPEARRFMWDVISNTMAGRSVILTTHSMEEAEALSHNIGIMVGGRFRCLGTTQHLKNKYGKGYSMEIRTADERVDQLREWVTQVFPTAEIEEQIGGQCRYQIPQSDIQLSSAFRELEQSQDKIGYGDFSVSQTTLEQVFVRFAAHQEEETGMDAASLKMAIRSSFPNFVDMFRCQPKRLYEWTVPGKDGHPETRVEIEFPKAALLCCSQNPGQLSVDGVPLEELALNETCSPGCRDAPCIRGCCCCCRSGTCCSETSKRIFTANGRNFEVVPYNEIPSSRRAHPCFLFVDGKEVDTGIDRNQFLEQIFCGAAKKWCYVAALPLFGVSFVLSLAKVMSVSYFASLLFWIVIIFCVCWNCCRSKHYANTPPEPEVYTIMPNAAVETSCVEANALHQHDMQK